MAAEPHATAERMIELEREAAQATPAARCLYRRHGLVLQVHLGAACHCPRCRLLDRQLRYLVWCAWSQAARASAMSAETFSAHSRTWWTGVHIVPPRLVRLYSTLTGASVWTARSISPSRSRSRRTRVRTWELTSRRRLMLLKRVGPSSRTCVTRTVHLFAMRSIASRMGVPGP